MLRNNDTELRDKYLLLKFVNCQVPYCRDEGLEHLPFGAEGGRGGSLKSSFQLRLAFLLGALQGRSSMPCIAWPPQIISC